VSNRVKYAALTATAVIALVSFGTAAGAATVSATFIQTSDDSSPTAPVGNIGNRNTVTVTDNGTGTLDILVKLASGWGLVNTGASSGSGSLVFGLFGISSLTFGAVNPSTFQSNGTNTFFPTGTTETSPVTSATASGATLSAPGKFIYTPDGYGMSYTANGGSAPFNNLEFTITQAGGLSLTTFLADLQSSTDATAGDITHCGASSSGCFYADVINNNRTGGPTGLIDFGQPTPLPATLPLLGSGLGAMWLLGRRKRKAQAVAF
jgi:hypothetical protein